MAKKRTIESYLPLTPALFHVLLALADGEKHGYVISKEIARRTNNEVRLSTGTLYGIIKRLLDDEMIEESAERPDFSLDDQRRRYYRLTKLGKAVAEAEAERMERVLALARLKHVLGPAASLMVNMATRTSDRMAASRSDSSTRSCACFPPNSASTSPARCGRSFATRKLMPGAAGGTAYLRFCWETSRGLVVAAFREHREILFQDVDYALRLMRKDLLVHGGGNRDSGHGHRGEHSGIHGCTRCSD